MRKYDFAFENEMTIAWLERKKKKKNFSVKKLLRIQLNTYWVSIKTKVE